MKYIETLQDKKLVALEKKQLKESMQELASVLTASTTLVPKELTEKIDGLTTALLAAITELRNDTTVPDKIADDFQKVADYVVNVSKEQSTDLKEVAQKIVTALEAIKLPDMPTIPEVKIPDFPKMEMPDFSKIKVASPVVNVPAPIVNVPAPIINIPKNDFSPIEAAIKGLKEEDELDLSDFRPHDIIDEDKDTQYIGFLAPSGQWYIMENKVKENTIRYVFGKSKYSEAFEKAGSYKYTLLSEAINAL